MPFALKKLGFVEHHAQEPLQAFAVTQNGEQTPLAHAARIQARHVPAELRPICDEPIDAPLEIRQPLEYLRRERFDGEERRQTDERANAHCIVFAVPAVSNRS